MTDRHAMRSYSLRMPDDLRLELKRLSVENKKTLNAEIVERLFASIRSASGRKTVEYRLLALESDVASLKAKKK